ncbi:metallophosphoesterase [Helicobacter brantae]|uniref:Calcineurin-like phosphoesterase domain-containing protein n=1 Tax=Helicobacter brantae TaxID=375927 RepID=A0A3D8IZ79_9HELI|nr:metallophosphoesterase [Helicobacter brantae]RDU70569.1 hypothetical protein CQA58_05200 [Helicobacter brantae]
MCLKLNSDALFIADSHYNPHNATALVGYLQALKDNPPSQIVLMGDVTQVLVGNLKSSIQANMPLLQALKELKDTQIFWLEGNHDFALKNIAKILDNATFIPRTLQPIRAEFEGKIYLLAHGDLFLSWRYSAYINLMRHSTFWFWLVDFLSSGEIYEEVEEKLYHKPIKKRDFHFFEFSAKRIASYKKYALKKGYDFDGIIEGHFHIGKRIQIKGIDYVALPAFYFTLQGISLTKILK